MQTGPKSPDFGSTNLQARSTGRQAGSTSPVWLIAWAVWIEAVRRKDLWVIAVLMAIYLVAAVALSIVRGASPEETRFIFNLGLTVSFWLAAVLTALFAARELPAEMENLTLYPLLAKPVERRDVILGKFAAVSSVGMATLAVFFLFVRAVSHWLPEFSAGLFLQCAVLQMLALALLAAITLCATVWLPAAVSLIIGLVLFFAGGPLMGMAKSNVASSFGKAVEWLCYYLPDFDLFNLATRFTDGGPPLPAGEFFCLLLYSCVLTLVFLGAASAGFERKAL